MDGRNSRPISVSVGCVHVERGRVERGRWVRAVREWRAIVSDSRELSKEGFARLRYLKRSRPCVVRCVWEIDPCPPIGRHNPRADGMPASLSMPDVRDLPRPTLRASNENPRARFPTIVERFNNARSCAIHRIAPSPGSVARLTGYIGARASRERNEMCVLCARPAGA